MNVGKYFLPILVFIYLFPFLFSLQNYSFILLPFKGKNLLKEEDPEDYYDDPDISDQIIIPEVNATQFLSKYFYNGMYSEFFMGKGRLLFYVNISDSIFSVDKCNIRRVYVESAMKRKDDYIIIDSNTFQKNGDNMANELFQFYDQFSQKNLVKIGNQKGEGLDFYYKKDNNNVPTCGYIGLNINSNLDKTNFITQLKKKNYINKYTWTLNYLTESEGNIIVGTEPHFYLNNSFYMSQYCTIKVNPNQSKETSWAFSMDEVTIVDKDKKKIGDLLQNKVDILVDRGLIIGTDEYKKKIDDLIFNEMFTRKICSRESILLDNVEKDKKEEYYIYYCKTMEFYGNKYTSSGKPYNKFPSIKFYLKESNMTFILTKERLFHELFNRIYFLVAFKKSNIENKVWGLGEPFLSEYQFTFDQEAKSIGFYNPVKPKIPNSEYMNRKTEDGDGNNTNGGEEEKKPSIALFIVIGVLVVGFLVVLAYILGKKLNEKRKNRANELMDENFDYKAEKNEDEKIEKDEEKDESLGMWIIM